MWQYLCKDEPHDHNDLATADSSMQLMHNTLASALKLTADKHALSE